MCPAHDDDTRIRDVTEATNVEQMMSPSAFSLIRPTIATRVAISSFREFFTRLLLADDTAGGYQVDIIPNRG